MDCGVSYQLESCRLRKHEWIQLSRIAPHHQHRWRFSGNGSPGPAEVVGRKMNFDPPGSGIEPRKNFSEQRYLTCGYVDDT